MPENFIKQQKKSTGSCGRGCFVCSLITFLLLMIAYQVWVSIAESTIFFEAKNISLPYPYDLLPQGSDMVLPEEKKIAYFRDRDNRAIFLSVSHNKNSDNIALFMSGYNPQIQPNGRIILRENDEYVVFVEQVWVRACFISINVNPYTQFRNKSRFTIYRIHKEVLEDKTYEVRTEFLGYFDTNIFGAWRGNTKKLSISPDGKYIVMNAYTVNSRSLGKFRNKEVLLVWEIGDNVVEKDIVDSKGNKIPIIIKTEEEMERK